MVSERQRRWAPKVRTGCLTCKRRKKRCDEEKPICQRCRKGGYVCDGYENSPQRSSACIDTGSQIRLSGPDDGFIDEKDEFSFSGDLLNGAQLNFLYFTSDQRYTQFFIARVAPVLATTEQWRMFWEDTIPLTSIKDTPIHHAMLALSSAYECKYLNIDRNHTTRLKISQAIHSSMVLSMSINSTLILCRLLAAVSQSAGDWKTTMIHLRNGWRILLESRQGCDIDPTLLQLLGPTFLCASTYALEPGKAVSGTGLADRESIIKLDRTRSLFAVSMSALSWNAIVSSVVRASIMLSWSNMTRVLCALIFSRSSTSVFSVEPGTVPISVVSSRLQAEGRPPDLDDLHGQTILLLCELTESVSQLHEDSLTSRHFAHRLRYLAESFLVCAFMLDANADVGMFWSEHRPAECDIDVHLLRLGEDKANQHGGFADGHLATRLQLDRRNNELYLERICPYRSGFLPAFKGFN